MTDTQERKKLVVRIAEKYGVEKDKLLETLKATAFRQKENVNITNEQMMALLIVAEQYGLNPFTKELYAFPDKGGIVPVVSIDGWSRIINSHKEFDGLEFKYSDNLVMMDGARVACHEWIDVSIYRKDRAKPSTVREYLDEVYRAPISGTGKNGPYTIDGPWQTHPKRFLRHKGVIQCARLALGFSGIHDQDEAERIIDMGEADVVGKGISTRATTATPNETMLLEYRKADPFIEGIIKRTQQNGAWQSAYDYIENRYKGAVLDYATQKIREAEIESMPSALNSFADEANARTEANAPAKESDHSRVPIQEGHDNVPHDEANETLFY